MGYLEDKTVYLCGNIAKTKHKDFGVKWRDDLTPILEASYGINVINPCKSGEGDTESDHKKFISLIKRGKYDVVKKEFYRVIRKDLRAVDKADFLIFYHMPTMPTVGSIHEVINAVGQKKPVLIFVEKDDIDHLNPWLLTLIKPQWLFTDWNEMFAYLKKIDHGDLDSSHWW